MFQCPLELVRIIVIGEPETSVKIKDTVWVQGKYLFVGRDDESNGE